MTPEEQAASRDKAFGKIGQENETNRRQLAAVQGATGVRGSAAAAGQRSFVLQAISQRADFERDLLLQNNAIKANALNAFESVTNFIQQQKVAAKQSNFAIEQFNASQQLKQKELEKFNLQQLANERYQQISTGFTFAQLGSANRNQTEQNMLAEQIARIQKGIAG